MTRKELRRGSDRKEGIVQEILAARVESKTLPNRRQARQYLEKYVADVPIEDLEGRSPSIMARIALDHLEFGATRKRGQSLFRIYNPTEQEHGYTSPFTFVEMVNDDMPFLVNSITAAINRHDLGVHITVHPIVRVRRDGKGRLQGVTQTDGKKGQLESYIRFAIDRETDPQVLKLLQQEIKQVLSDIKLAVRDWKEMVARMIETRDLLDFGPKRADEQLRDECRAFLQWMADEHFTFLGYREYKISKRGKKVLLNPVAGSGLGLLSRKTNGGSIELTDEMERLRHARDWLVLTKANSRSTVHRNAYLDYVGVKDLRQARPGRWRTSIHWLVCIGRLQRSATQYSAAPPQNRQDLRAHKSRCRRSSRQSALAHH